jgi:membrane-bound metal-dependent hydrolase YbcI (DUF457 family)
VPFTPFHLGPHTLAGLPVSRGIDLPVFILANVFIDIEPLAIMIFDLPYPLHGIMHSFLISLAILVPLSIACFRFRDLFSKVMLFLRLPYNPGLVKMIVSGILGGWLHILTDAPLYADIRPLYPLTSNPFYGLIDMDLMYTLCSWALLPATLYYIGLRLLSDRQPE